MPKPASPTPDDTALIRAVAQAISAYMTGANPEKKVFSQKDLAAILNVSPATITNLLGLLDPPEDGSKHQKDLSGQLLLRLLKAGIPIEYGELRFVAVSSKPQQIAFVFESGLPCENSPDGTAVRVEKKGPAASQLKVEIRIAG